MSRHIEDIVSDILGAGCHFELGGPQWVRVMPPPPVALILEIAGRGDELSDEVIRRGLYEKEPQP